MDLLDPDLRFFPPHGPIEVFHGLGEGLDHEDDEAHDDHRLEQEAQRDAARIGRALVDVERVPDERNARPHDHDRRGVEEDEVQDEIRPGLLAHRPPRVDDVHPHVLVVEHGVPGGQHVDDAEEVPLELLQPDGARPEGVAQDHVREDNQHHEEHDPGDRLSEALLNAVDLPRELSEHEFSPERRMAAHVYSTPPASRSIDVDSRVDSRGVFCYKAPMLLTTIAGSLPKPAWLAKPRALWAPWSLSGEALAEAKRDAVVLALREQEDAGIDIVTDGEQSRQHFVHGFLEAIEGVDFDRRVTIGIRADRYKAEVPTVVGPLRRRGPVHADEVRFARAQTARRLKFTLPGPMTIVDTLADAHYRDRARLSMEFARVLNEEARELAALGVDVLQFDEPAFNVYMDDVRAWGIEALHRAVEGVGCRTAVHICYGYGIQANVEWKATLGSEWRQYEKTFPLLARSRIDQVSLECASSRVPLELLALLAGKDVLVGAVDVATDRVETPEEVAATIRRAMAFVPPERLYPCTNCGMVPLGRDVARGKLRALAAGAAIVRRELGVG